MQLSKIYTEYLLICLALYFQRNVAKIPILTDDTFYKEIAQYDHSLILFYAPWCKQSQKLLPPFADAHEELLNDDPQIFLAQVDCTEQSDKICEKYTENSNYPILKIFTNGEFEENYKGPLHLRNGIIKYMRGFVKPAFIELSSNEELTDMLNSTRNAMVVGLFKAEDSAMRKVFEAVSEKLKITLTFVFLDSTDGDKIVLYRPLYLANKFEKSSLTYLGNINITNLNAFILKNMNGLAGIRKLENEDSFEQPLIIAYFDIDFKMNPKSTKYWRNRILLVAKEFEDEEITFSVASWNEFIEELQSVGIDFIKNDKPLVVARKYHRKYIMSEEFSVDSLRSFAARLLNGTLEPFLKSEPIPLEQTGSVIKVVAKTFERLVERNTKDVLIKFHVPWCGHCKTLAPIYEELAKKLQNEDIDIMEMNGEDNEIFAPYEVTGFPTIYWVKKNWKNHPVKYVGGRKVDDFIKFIAKEATEELKGWDRNGKVKSIRLEL